MKPLCLTLVALALLAAAARAERPPQKKEAADLVVTGTFGKITTKTSKFGNDGERTDYAVKVTIDKVESGKDVKAGDVVEVTWFRVTKNPSKAFPGAYGHKYDVKADQQVRLWLMKEKTGYVVIYNSGGVETLKK